MQFCTTQLPPMRAGFIPSGHRCRTRKTGITAAGPTLGDAADLDPDTVVCLSQSSLNARSFCCACSSSISLDLSPSTTSDISNMSRSRRGSFRSAFASRCRLVSTFFCKRCSRTQVVGKAQRISTSSETTGISSGVFPLLMKHAPWTG